MEAKFQPFLRFYNFNFAVDKALDVVGFNPS